MTEKVVFYTQYLRVQNKTINFSLLNLQQPCFHKESFRFIWNHMIHIDDYDEYNVLAIELIEYLGNDKPAQEQIDLVEFLVSKALNQSHDKN